MTTVPYRLRRLEQAGTATAVLLLSEREADLLALVAGIGATDWPPVYAVSGGFLIKGSIAGGPAGAPVLRLRALANNLFVPADAELEPALLPDEAAGLVRERGLVFLPGGGVLGFAVHGPLPASAVLSAPRLPERAWQRLPARPHRAEHLRQVLLEQPEQASESILEQGGGGIGGEDPFAGSPSPGASAAGSASVAVGNGLLWLANLLRWRALAKYAAGLISSALDRVPRLSESLLGKQEAALRALLREFREGNLERALRRALPLGGENLRGGVAASSGNLPSHDTRFSLAGLLAEGSGPGSVWYCSGDVQALLAAEYRKAAAAAAARGDHRRAAFIYGKLLRDYRLAASALERGALYHDAAILYLEKVGDSLAAARAFAAAGDVDRALKLYRERHEHALAGDLLRHAGDEEGAVAEYVLAAAALARAGDFLAAGDLLHNRAGRVDLAREQFAAGWRDLSAPRASACLLRLVDIYAGQDSPDDLLTAVEEADAYYALPGRETEASQFFEALTRLAERPHLAGQRDRLRDRALLGLARKMRQRSESETRSGTIVSSLLGRSGLWPAAVVSDADFAFKAAVADAAQPREPSVAENDRFRLHECIVTAVCASPAGGVLFVGFADGTLIAFTPGSSGRPTLRPMLTSYLTREAGTVIALATSAMSESAVAIVENKRGERTLRRYARAGNSPLSLRYTLSHHRPLPGEGPCGLSPMYELDYGPGVALWDGEKIQFLAGPELVPVQERALQVRPGSSFAAAWCFPNAHGRGLLVDGGNCLRCISPGIDAETLLPTGWSPSLPAGSTLRCAPLSWLHKEDRRLELAGVGKYGEMCWSDLSPGDTHPVVANLRFPSGPRPYRAVALVGRGQIAAVCERGVDWVRSGGKSVSVVTSTVVKLPDAIACFFCNATNEVFVVCSRGDIVRVPRPQ
jgi:hypothetical protein